MYQTLDCIALKTVRYNDRHDIISVYTRQAGRVSFALSSPTGREGRRRRALMMPLGRFACVADLRPGREIHTMREVTAHPSPAAVATDPIRSIIALFVTDLLNCVLTEPLPDAAMFDYIERAVERLHTSRAIANYPVCFVFGLLQSLGIEPDYTAYTPGAFLDLIGGTYTTMPPMHGKWLDSATSAAAARLQRMTFANMHCYRLTRAERNTILDRQLEYLSLHHSRLQSLTSLAILREL